MKQSRRVLVPAFGVIALAVAGVGVWILLSPGPSLSVPPDFRGTAAAGVYQLVAPHRGEPITTVDSNLVASGTRSNDDWVIAVRDPEPTFRYEALQLRSYLFNDGTVLTTYAIDNDDGSGWVLDGVRFNRHTPSLKKDE